MLMWSQAGPCSELYYDFKPEQGSEGANLAEDDDRFIEFYNLVFMESNRGADGEVTPLENKNIDTGMGLERMAQILQVRPGSRNSLCTWFNLVPVITFSSINMLDVCDVSQRLTVGVDKLLDCHVS